MNNLFNRGWAGAAISLCTVAVSLLIAACGGGAQLAGGEGGIGSGGTGIVFTGAPAVGSKVTAIDNRGVAVASAVTDREGAFNIQVPQAGIYLLRAELQSGTVLHNLLNLAAGSQTARSNISPISELFTAITLQSDPIQSPQGKLSLPNQRLLDGAVLTAQLLGPILTSQQAVLGSDARTILNGILNGKFATNNQGLDGVVDRISVVKVSGQYSFGSPAAPSIPLVQLQTNASDLASAISVVQSRAYQQAVTGNQPQLEQAPATLVLSGQSNWRTDGQSMTLWIPKAQSENWSLSFETEALPESLNLQWAGGQLGAVYYESQYRPDGTVLTRYLLQGLTQTAYPDDSLVSWRLVGSGLPSAAVDLSNCKFNGVACAIRFITASKTEGTIESLLSIYRPTDAGTLIQRIKNQLLTVASTSPLTPRGLGTSVAAQPSGLQMVWELESRWEGGYGGVLTVSNSSSEVVTGSSWSQALNVALPEGIFMGGPWNMQATRDASTGYYTIRPMPTQADLEPGTRAVSGYLGTELSLLCPLRTLAASQATFKLGARMTDALNTLCATP